MLKRPLILLIASCGLLLSSSRLQSQVSAPPNILFILADDLGYSDLGCYGSEIETPHIDSLAEQGIRFSHFRSAPMCTTSRVAIHTGMPYFAAGGMTYHKNVLPMPEALRQSGYYTALTGKWHASSEHPVATGYYDRFFGFTSGMSDCFAGGSDWFLNDEPYTNFGKGFSATKNITEHSIRFMSEAVEQQKPFFMLVSYNAPHHPLQADKKTYEKYLGRYHDGFEIIRDQRMTRQKEIGLIDPAWSPAIAELGVRKWDELPAERQKIEDMRMAAYAAMVDEMDKGVGLLLKFLAKQKIGDNTLVIFTSDNGGYYNNGDYKRDVNQQPWKPNSNQTISSGWGWVQNTPFSLYKQTCHEGGLAVPFIVHWPRQLHLQPGSITDVPAEFPDLLPTLLEVAGGKFPKEWKGQSPRPMTGVSFLSAITQGKKFTPPTRFHWFTQSRALIDGDYKAVATYDGPWQLYHLGKDRTEQTDLAKAQPERVKQMVQTWHGYAKSYQIPPQFRKPARDIQLGWGWHRLKMFCPELTALKPGNAEFAPTSINTISMTFSDSVDFANTPNRHIYLYQLDDDSEPIWQFDPDQSHPSQGKNRIIFDGLPPLKPDTQYFILTDPGAFTVGGKKVGVINDGAYWWRFRTAAP